MRHVIRSAAAAFALLFTVHAHAQMYPPGTFSIDGIPVVCGGVPTIVTPNIPDGGMNNGHAILMNPVALGNLPTVLKLYVYAHECGHSVVGANEMNADCWAIRTGRNQGWFPPQAFGYLMQMFQNNPGSLRHPPGEMRVRLMMQCYNS